MALVLLLRNELSVCLQYPAFPGAVQYLSKVLHTFVFTHHTKYYTCHRNATNFQRTYPWTSSPPIANAAMGGYAGPALATAVSLAGGVGFIGSVDDMTKLDQQLDSARSTLQQEYLKVTDPSTRALGVGFLLFVAPLEDAVAVIERHRPAAIWLACPRQSSDLEVWSKAMRNASPSSKIWIQTASVADALHVALTCSPDILIMQGSDAGGHGPCPGAGIVSLIPETRDALKWKASRKSGFLLLAGFVMGGELLLRLLAALKGW